MEEYWRTMLDNAPFRFSHPRSLQETLAEVTERGTVEGAARVAMAIANSEFELRRLGFDEPVRIAHAQAHEVLDQWVRALELSLLCGAI